MRFADHSRLPGKLAAWPMFQKHMPTKRLIIVVDIKTHWFGYRKERRTAGRLCYIINPNISSTEKTVCLNRAERIKLFA